MTNEQAIRIIKMHCYFANLVPDAKEALDMAIDALEQQHIEFPTKHEIAEELAKSTPVKAFMWVGTLRNIEMCGFNICKIQRGENDD
ncbi:hypothetical protein [Pseudobutyrivibrio sp.]